MRDIASFARPQGSSQLANALCQQAAGSAGESVSGQVPGFFPEFFRTGIWVPGITRLWDQRLFWAFTHPMESQGWCHLKLPRNIRFHRYLGHVPRGNGSNVKRTNYWGQNFPLFLFQGHFSSSISSIFSSPFLLLWFRSSLLLVWTLRIVFWCILYLHSVTPIPIYSLKIAEGSPWRFNGNDEKTVCSTSEGIATPVYWLGRRERCCPYTLVRALVRDKVQCFCKRLKLTDWVKCFRVIRLTVGKHSIGAFEEGLKKSFKMTLFAQHSCDSMIILMKSIGWRPNYAHFSRKRGWGKLDDLPNITQWAHSRMRI